MQYYRVPPTQLFEAKVMEEFSYLVTNLGFSGPTFLSNRDEHRDRVVYYKENAAIEILNAWHPSDYGFEVNYYADRKLVDAANDRVPTSEMVYYKIKEQQDDNLTFIGEGARALRLFLVEKGIG